MRSGNKRKKNKHTCTQAAGRALRGQGYCFVCWSCGQSCNVTRWWTTEGRQERRDGRNTSREDGRDREPKQTVDLNEVASLFACCFGVIWCVISHDISRYIVISYSISRDITRYDISRHRIHIPNCDDWYRDIVSRRNLSQYRTLVGTTVVDQGKRIKRTDEGTHKTWKPNTDHRPMTMASNTVLRCLKPRAKGCPRVYMKRASVWVD